jgi:hypothetical protein
MRAVLLSKDLGAQQDKLSAVYGAEP